MDRIQTMTVFTAVADEGGFAAAARRLNMSPPSVTRAVSELETRLGARLFHRTTRSVGLTESGNRYLADCRRILADLEEADRHAAGTHARPRGSVSVSSSIMFGRRIATPVLLELLETYPELSIDSIYVDRIVHLLDEGIDVAVRIAHLPDSSLPAIRVGAVRRVLCAAPDYLAAKGRPVRPDDLARHLLLDFPNIMPGREWRFEHDGAPGMVKIQSRFRVNSGDGAIAAALARKGIAPVLSYMIADHLKSGALELVLEGYETPPIPVHVLHKEPGLTSARVRATVDFLVDRLRRHPALRC